jgi:hypothetical protein
MTFVPKEAADSNFALRFYKKTASQAFALNSLVAWPSSQTGYFIPATSSTTNHIGTILKAVAATDSDYAENTLCPILVPTKGVNSIWVATTTGTAVATDVGGNFDLSDAVTVNRAAESVGAFTMTGFRSATLTEGYLRIPTSTT